MRFTIFEFDELDSTNTEALRRARENAPEGTCVTARRQTDGRGRHGRRWISEQDSGLYFSVVLRPGLPPTSLPLLTLMAGIAVAETLKELGTAPDIKWVNDILIDERKIAGILAEVAETASGTAVVVGIGININDDNIAADLRNIATSIIRETGKAPEPPVLVDMLQRHLGEWYGRLRAPHGSADIITSWQERSSYAFGKSVRAMVPHGSVEGVTEGLGPDGALRLRDEAGMMHVIRAGDIERLRAKASTD